MKQTSKFKRMAACAVCLASLFSLSLGLSACGGQEEGEGETENNTENNTETEVPAGDYYTFTDDAGEEIVLKEKPETVAVLFSSYADMWNLAGGTVSITVGESVERGFADETVLLVDDGAGKTIDTELLVSYEPDFVIGSADIAAQSECAEFLNGAGIPAALFQVDSFDDYLRMLDICTDITGDKEAYETYGSSLEPDIEATIQKQAYAGKTILFIRAGSSARSVKAKSTQDHFACEMLAELGATNIADSATVLLDGLSMEVIVEENPDYVFFISMGDEEASQAYVSEMLQEEAWASLAAVTEGRCLFLPKDLFHYKPNSRWAEAYAYLSDLASA